MGEGTVAFGENEAENRHGLDAVMGQHAGTGGEYALEVLVKTGVLHIAIPALSGKRAG